MIDRQSRNCLALTLRRYVAGIVHNDDLAEVQVDWRDRGANAVYQMAWNLYSDNCQHYAKERHAIPREVKREIAKWILFLRTDREYLWPEYSFIGIYNWPMNLLTFGWWEARKRRRWEEFLKAGDFCVWPFLHKTELEEAIKRPTLLSGLGRG